MASCGDFKETAENIAKTGFKMFLGITPTITNWSADNKEFSLVLDENPLSEFVELPETLLDLWYSNIYCGVIRGALEMVYMVVEVVFVQDVLRGDPITEMRVKFVKSLQEESPPNDE